MEQKKIEVFFFKKNDFILNLIRLKRFKKNILKNWILLIMKIKY